MFPTEYPNWETDPGIQAKSISQAAKSQAAEYPSPSMTGISSWDHHLSSSDRLLARLLELSTGI